MLRSTGYEGVPRFNNHLRAKMFEYLNLDRRVRNMRFKLYTGYTVQRLITWFRNYRVCHLTPMMIE